MEPEPPTYYTLIDAFWAMFEVGIVSLGCYLGWKCRDTFAAMFVGGCIAYWTWFAIRIAILAPSTEPPKD